MILDEKKKNKYLMIINNAILLYCYNLKKFGINMVPIKKNLEQYKIKFVSEKLENGMANTNNKTLTINVNIFSDDEKAYHVLFHEFTHISNSFHYLYFEDSGNKLINDFFSNKYFKLYPSLKSKYEERMANPYDNLYYIRWGFLFLEEMVVEEVATELSSIIEKKDRKMNIGNSRLCGQYEYDFSGYQFCQHLFKYFVNYLKLNDVSNTTEFALKSLDINFVKIFLNYLQRDPYKVPIYLEILGYLGIVIFQHYDIANLTGNDIKLDRNFVDKNYFNLVKIIKNNK